MIFLYLCLGVVSASLLQYDPRYFTSHYDKRTLDFDDPRLLSAAFGKRSGAPSRSTDRLLVAKRIPYLGGDGSDDSYVKRDHIEVLDPRFFTNSFGKRSEFYLDDPRFSSMSFGRRR